MASLTTVYIISVIVASIAGMGSAFLGNKIYPLKGGEQSPTVEEPEEVPAVEEAEPKELPVVEEPQAEELPAAEEPEPLALEEPKPEPLALENIGGNPKRRRH